MRTSSVCCVLFLRLLTWKPGWDQPVVEGWCSELHHWFACQQPTFYLRPPSAPSLTSEALCHVEGDAQNLFVGSADIKVAFHQMRIPGWRPFLHFPLFSHPKLVTLKERSTKNVVPPDTLPMVFSWAMFFCQHVTDRCTLAGSEHSPLFVCRDHSVPPLLGSKHGMGSVGFRSSYAGNFGVLARGANCTKVHLARLIAGVQKAGRDVHDMFLASGSADVLGHEVSLASACSGARKRISHIRSVGRSLLVDASSGGRWISSMVTRLFSGAQQSWCSLNP